MTAPTPKAAGLLLIVRPIASPAAALKGPRAITAARKELIHEKTHQFKSVHVNQAPVGEL